MRVLTESEMDSVAGGDAVSEIVVTASRNTWGAGSYWGSSSYEVSHEHPGDVAVIAEGDGFDWLDGVLAGVLSDQISNLVQAEQRLATQFDPGQIKEKQVAWGANGRVFDCWTMKDGTIWFDRDNNGYVDQHMRTASDGSVWTDEGIGWHEVSPPRR
jgi:hypothetical protein